MNVGIIALLQETNTFIAEATTLRHFEENLLLTGEPVRAQLADTQHEIGGFFTGLASNGLEAVPIFAARALPFVVDRSPAKSSAEAAAWDVLAREVTRTG